MMKLKLNVIFFSTLREATGREEMILTLNGDGPVLVRDVLAMLYEQIPKLREWDGQVLLALDQAYVNRDAEVVDGQELAIMPPVQGG